MGTKWHGFVAADTIGNPALPREYTTILHAPKPGTGLRVYAEQPGKLYRGWFCTFVSGNVPERVSSQGPELDALGSYIGPGWH